MAKAKGKKSSNNQPPRPPVTGRGTPPVRSVPESAASRAARAQKFDIQQRLDEDTFLRAKQPSRSMSQSARRALETRLGELDRQIQIPRTRMTPISGGANPMSGRTVEAGTRSMLQAMVRFMRGGGGSILRGK